MRTLVDIPEEDISWLDERARAQGKSRAAVVREAVSAYRAEKREDPDTMLNRFEAGFGAWKHRIDEIGDVVEWQRRERASTTRAWDDDYEEVKAEFPDLFDEEDDRQRAIYLAMKDRADRT